MAEIRCFWTEPSGRALLSLRRYSPFPKPGVERPACPNVPGEHSYHDASIDIGQAPIVLTARGYVSSLPVDKTDSRWPQHCACGYEFVPEDDWQLNQEEIYVSTDPARPGEWSSRKLPPGAMFNAWWCGGDRDNPTKPSPGGDGIWLAVALPPNGGDDTWIVDGKASNNPSPVGWHRTGTVPNITANPSILTPRYHGWLRDGVLVEC